MKVYEDTLKLINNAINNTHTTGYMNVKGNEAYLFMSGYIRALYDNDLITREQRLALHEKMKKIPT
ncbi:hypothetical protein ABNR98_004467 [Salmonella enterica]